MIEEHNSPDPIREDLPSAQQEAPNTAPDIQPEPVIQPVPVVTPEPVIQPAPPTPKPPKKQRRGMGVLGVIALSICFGLISGAAGAFLYGRFTGSDRTASQESGQTHTSSQGLIGSREEHTLELQEVPAGEIMTAAQVYANNVNSTVGITTSITTNYWGYQTTSAASGSGFIITDDGYILTNYHVVESSNSITVALYNGESYDAALVGYDQSNDIAVLKIDAKNLSPVILGSSDQLNVGDSVVAIGNPLGELTFSLTAGLVSAIDREITMSSGTTMTLIQTDCAINSGNSGGALFNLYGEVVGITNAKYSSSGSQTSIDNIGFAIPIDDVWSIIESIIEKGYISKPYIGVTVTDVSSEAQGYGLPQGAAVQSVTEDSPAEKAGLKANDIITHIDETAITGKNELVAYVGACNVGDTFQVTVYRQGETVKLSLTVGEQVQSAIPEEETTVHSYSYQIPGYPWY